MHYQVSPGYGLGGIFEIPQITLFSAGDNDVVLSNTAVVSKSFDHIRPDETSAACYDDTLVCPKLFIEH
jgi:hypothetical protein